MEEEGEEEDEEGSYDDDDYVVDEKERESHPPRWRRCCRTRQAGASDRASDSSDSSQRDRRRSRAFPRAAIVAERGLVRGGEKGRRGLVLVLLLVLVRRRLPRPPRRLRSRSPRWRWTGFASTSSLTRCSPRWTFPCASAFAWTWNRTRPRLFPAFAWTDLPSKNLLLHWGVVPRGAQACAIVPPRRQARSGADASTTGASNAHVAASGASLRTSARDVQGARGFAFRVQGGRRSQPLVRQREMRSSRPGDVGGSKKFAHLAPRQAASASRSRRKPPRRSRRRRWRWAARRRRRLASERKTSTPTPTRRSVLASTAYVVCRRGDARPSLGTCITRWRRACPRTASFPRSAATHRAGGAGA